MVVDALVISLIRRTLAVLGVDFDDPRVQAALDQALRDMTQRPE